MIQQSIIDLIKKKHNDKKTFFYHFIECIVRLIDIDNNILHKNDVINHTNIFRKKMADDLISKEYYKKLDYNLKIEKNEIYNNLVCNKNINENVKIYISVYVNLNIIVINNNKYRYINKYNNCLNSIILLENNDKYCPIYIVKNTEIITIFDHNTISNVLVVYSFDNRLIFNSNINNSDYKKINQLKTYTLYKLQEICMNYDINIYKYIDTKKLLKKKIELFEELKYKLINLN